MPILTIPRWLGDVDTYYDNRYYKTGKDAQDAHEAIRPTYIDINPEDININSLINRVRKDKIKELILALKPSIEGETTALYGAHPSTAVPVINEELNQPLYWSNPSKYKSAG